MKTHLGVVARILTLALTVGIFAAVQQSVSTSPAEAAPVVGFDPGNILSDALMYDVGTMSRATIQDFLNVKGANCSPAAGNTCIKAYTESTPTRPADALCPGGYLGGSDSAATIIAKASRACGINPQVLLVTLQKEQGLITSTAGKSVYTYSRALGFGCPDNAGGWCDPAYAGFANQVYSAAKQLKRYAANPTGYSYRAGRTNTILWNPNTACGSSQVYITNQATASLYNYTPYRPNQAALNAGYGSGDGCSSYGNRNFYLYFTDWFGSTIQRSPVGVLDSATAINTTTIQVTGWAFDPDVSSSIDVHFYVDGVGVYGTRASAYRPDVGMVYGRGNQHGYDVQLKMSPGVHTVCAYAIDANGGSNPQIGCRSVTVANQRPAGTFDYVQPGATGTIQVVGWAFDPDFAGSIDVHVYVDGVGTAYRANAPRPDVSSAYRRDGTFGFDLTVPVSNGNHTVCVYAIDSDGGSNPSLGCKSVTAVNTPPQGSIDWIQSPGAGLMQVFGWALDRDTAAPIDVQVLVDGVESQTIKANTSRPDVAVFHGVADNHGFDSFLPIPAGVHSVCFSALDSTGGAATNLGCKAVTVTSTPPIGAVETTTSTTATGGLARSSITVSGWAWDFDTTTPVTVRVLVDGVVSQTASASTTAGLAHAAVVGTNRTTIGFTATAAASVGSHKVCVDAYDVPTKTYTSIGCADVVNVANADPTGSIDTLAGVASNGAVPAGIQVTGWALDWDTTNPIDVHFYIDGVWATLITANNSRPDVEAFHHNGALHGFEIFLPSAPGTHQLCSYSINTPSGNNPAIGGACRTVTVP